jgi:hypothetical protein
LDYLVSLSALDYAAAVAGPTSTLGGAFMLSPQARTFCQSLGLQGRPAYAIGRFCVLGEVDADVIVAAGGFWAADVLGASYREARELVRPADVMTPYLAAAKDWAHEHYGDWTGAARLGELAWLVADGCDVTAAPLFAGWRAVPRDRDDVVGDCAHALHVLRELRGARHLIAVVASGMTPLQAVLAGAGGSANAGFFGWEEPYEPVAHLAGTRTAVETATDALMAPAYDEFGEVEREDFLDLLTQCVHRCYPA